jgi:PadR family transcriptional regulator PadR
MHRGPNGLPHEIPRGTWYIPIRTRYPVPAEKPNPPFMTGVPELLILRLLAEREMYGYELVQSIQTATGHAVALGEGVVYPLLHALEERGHLRSRRKPIQGRTRVYYAVTASGKRRFQQVSREWDRITHAVSQVLQGGRHGLESV